MIDFLKEQRILITGGAGFIGSRLVNRLVSLGSQNILVFDNLHPQIHGENPTYLPQVPFVRADVTDRSEVRHAIDEQDPTIVIHLAAETGTGQSAEEVSRYCHTNVMGTSILVEELRKQKRQPERVILAATRAVYGEGAYQNSKGMLVVPPPRSEETLKAGVFVPQDAMGVPLVPIATPEDAAPRPGSVYGSTKLMQEGLITQVAGADWKAIALRLQNVYGPGQSLRNPYTGVLSIFCAQALSGQRLNIYEDGLIGRDFIFVDDVVEAFVAACHESVSGNEVINIGTGQAAMILDVARAVLSSLGLPDDRYDISGDFRLGDIRHAVADISRAQQVLNWGAEVSVTEGIEQLASWAVAEFDGAPV